MPLQRKIFACAVPLSMYIVETTIVTLQNL